MATRPSRAPRTKAAVQALPQGQAPAPAQPVSVASLRGALFTKEIPLTELWRTYYGRQVDLARIETALRGAEVGTMKPLTDLSREMVDRDGHLGMLLQKRLGAISALDWELTPATGPGIDPERADLYATVCRDQVNRIPSFRQRLFDLAWGLFDGRAALETQWRGPLYGPVRWEAGSLGWIHPRRISFGPEREFRIVDALYNTAYFPPVGEALRQWPCKFIEFRPRLFGEYPEREGLAIRALYWAFFKRFTQRERLILLELFGKPWRIVSSDKDAPEPAQKEDIEAMDQQVAALGGNNIARLPRGFKLNVEQPGEGAGDVHADVITYSNDEMSKLIVGQTMTSDAKPGDGIGGKQAEVHADQQLLILKRDAWAISEAIEDGLTDAIVMLNFGPESLSHAPNFKLKADPAADRTVEIDRIDKGVRAGIPVPLEQVYELSGFRAPEKGEAYLTLGMGPGETLPRPMVVYPTDELPDQGAVPPAPAGGGAQEKQGLDDNANALVEPDDEFDSPNIDDEGHQTEPNIGDPYEIPAFGSGSATAAYVPWGPRWTLTKIRLMEDLPQLRLCTGRELIDRIELTERSLFAREWHEHIHFAKQPETVNGSPEPIIDKAVREAARATARWADLMSDAADGATNANAILRKVNAAAATIDLAPLARIVERRMMHGLMLGALDANFEAESDQAVAPAKFAAPSVPVLTEPSFAHKPYDAALRFFRNKKVVDKATFEELSARAKQRAFTVARMASQEMLQTVHQELYRQVAEGVDLRTFKRFARERLESAGFVPANASHVETVFRTNVMNAYGAGRHAEMTQPATLKARPYWQILGVKDDRSRDTHVKVQSWVLRADDPIWQTAYPPFGFNCRCRVRSVSPELVEKQGMTVRSGSDIVGLPDHGFTSGTKALV